MTIHQKVKEDVIMPLADHLGLNFTKTNSSADKPPYPFMTYNITSPHIPQDVIQNFTTELIDSTEQEFEYDIKHTYISQPTLVISINSMEKEETSTITTAEGNHVMQIDEKAYQNAMKAWEWFEYVGREHLRRKGFVVVETMQVEERDIFQEVNYERRKGFDVTLRYLYTVEITKDTIEKVEMSINEQEKEIDL